jgi:uncharacterized Tic20 family protein
LKCPKLKEGIVMTENYPQDQPKEGGEQPYSGAPPPAPPPAPAYSQQVPAYGQQGQAPVSPSDARMWSLFAHLGGTFLSFLVPLVIYFVYKDRDPFIRRHSAQALNFHITIAIVYIVSVPLILVFGLGVLTFLAAAICAVVFSILAAIAANNGQEYTYPLTPQMIT